MNDEICVQNQIILADSNRKVETNLDRIYQHFGVSYSKIPFIDEDV